METSIKGEISAIYAELSLLEDIIEIIKSDEFLNDLRNYYSGDIESREIKFDLPNKVINQIDITEYDYFGDLYPVILIKSLNQNNINVKLHRSKFSINVNKDRKHESVPAG